MTLIKSISGIRGTIGGNPDEGLNPFDAVLEAARLRLRPILMTSIAFSYREICSSLCYFYKKEYNGNNE